MDRLKITILIIAVILFLGMGAGLFFLYRYSQTQKELYQREVRYQRVKAIKDSIDKRVLIREKEEELFQYRDSLRQQKIEYITLENEKSRKQIKEVIRLIPTSSSRYRDSLWTTEWERQDTTTYR